MGGFTMIERRRRTDPGRPSPRTWIRFAHAVAPAPLRRARPHVLLDDLLLPSAAARRLAHPPDLCRQHEERRVDDPPYKSTAHRAVAHRHPRRSAQRRLRARTPCNVPPRRTLQGSASAWIASPPRFLRRFLARSVETAPAADHPPRFPAGGPCAHESRHPHSQESTIDNRKSAIDNHRCHTVTPAKKRTCETNPFAVGTSRNHPGMIRQARPSDLAAARGVPGFRDGTGPHVNRG